MPDDELLPLQEIEDRLERVLAASPADATEIAWIEARRGRETSGKRRRDVCDRCERTVLVRVRESGRTGLHRTGAADVAELQAAVRTALAQARLAAPTPEPPRPPATPAPDLTPADLWDEELAGLSSGRARDLLGRLAGRGELARLAWCHGHVAVADQRGSRRAAAVTAVALQVVAGQGPGAGEARAAARVAAGLPAESVLERARRRQVAERAGDPEELLDARPPLLLAQEAVAPLLDLLNRFALSAGSFHDGSSYLCDKLGHQVFHRAIGLADDATDPRGLPFPFDLTGAVKRPVDLVADGVPVAPAVDGRLAQQLGREPTPHALDHDEHAAANLFLRPGEATTADLAAAAAGGVWIGALDSLQCFDPRSLRFRATVRGARRLLDGARAQALPDLVWEDSLPNVLSRVLGVGAEPVTIAGQDLLLGAVSAPMLAIERAESLRVA